MSELEDTIATEVADTLNPGEVIIGSVTAVATRSYDGGGVVITVVNPEVMPQWEVRGILTTALRQVDRIEEADQ